MPPYLSRLTRLVTLLLALGGSAALISTYLILALLQSTFSARKAMILAMRERMAGMVERLRAMRALRMYGPRRPAEAEGLLGAEADTEQALTRTRDGATVARDEVGTASDTSQAPDEHEGAAGPKAVTIIADADGPSPLISLAALSTLVGTLRHLASARGNTSTTRTSLLSTIEAYTSSLHRQLWNPAPGHSSYGFGRGSGTGVGLGSLDQQLALTGAGAGGGGGGGGGGAGGRSGGGQAKGARGRGQANGFGNAWSVEPRGVVLEDVRDRREEWDAVRREVRGVKGLLLGRRTFARPT